MKKIYLYGIYFAIFYSLSSYLALQFPRNIFNRLHIDYDLFKNFLLFLPFIATFLIAKKTNNFFISMSYVIVLTFFTTLSHYLFASLGYKLDFSTLNSLKHVIMIYLITYFIVCFFGTLAGLLFAKNLNSRQGSLKETKIEVDKMQNSSKNGYYMINNILDLTDILNNIDILFKDGILVLQGIKHKKILTKLKPFEFHGNLDMESQDKSRLTFGFFFVKKIPLYGIAIVFNNEAKRTLFEILKTYVPYEEVCENILYINPKSKKYILEFSLATSLFVSRDEVPNEDVFRKFCKSININSYCVDDFFK